MEKWLYVIVGLTFISGILGTAHHYYWIGVPQYWLPIGGIFSALEPLAFLGMAIYAYFALRRSGLSHPNRLALHWTMGSAVFSALGAGVLGPRPHLALGQQVDPRHADHAHARPHGVLRRLRDDRAGHDHLRHARADRPRATSERERRWATGPSGCRSAGMFGMTMAFAAAGIAQTYLERIMGVGYLDTQREDPASTSSCSSPRAPCSPSAWALFLVGLLLPGSPRRARRLGHRPGRRAGPRSPSRWRPPPTAGDGASGARSSRPPPARAGDVGRRRTDAEPCTTAVRRRGAHSSRRATRAACAVMLKGPTGCGKTRFVEHMAWRLGRPLVTVACHDDLSASDLVGRYLVHGGETVWQDGPLTRAVRHGALCYLDEVVEARQDTVVVIHPLADDRRILPLDKTGELLEAAPGFQLVVSYNPGYQHVLKDLKPSTRQRFVALDFDFPPPEPRSARSWPTRAAWSRRRGRRAGDAGGAGAAPAGPGAGRGAQHAPAGRHGPARGGGVPPRGGVPGGAGRAADATSAELLAAMHDLVGACSDVARPPWPSRRRSSSRPRVARHRRRATLWRRHTPERRSEAPALADLGGACASS